MKFCTLRAYLFARQELWQKGQRLCFFYLPGFFAMLLALPCLPAQGRYFQQDVQYEIDVRLNDEAQQLRGHIAIAYQNNAPHALDSLWFHLWPNAYRSRQTAFARQQERMNQSRFFFAEDSELGGIDSLDFEVNERSVRWALHPRHPDIAVLVLNEPLAAGKQVLITTPFRVQLPRTFSRLGHEGQAFQITQWYPKPAVYDEQGWHAMPYLDMGEFYSEFGSFDVRITLPENYLVAATGTLETESERAFLEEQIRVSSAHLRALSGEEEPRLSFPASSSRRKTIRFTAERVHDFAWFADKRFMVQKDTLRLPSGRTVDCWAFFTQEEQELWKAAAGYVKRSVAFYSDLVGEYPYPQATAVQTALGAGGGMEYPMITNCGLTGDAQSLDELIAHEVGHNWFYGILASNERAHAWMDEGLNSYYDHRYSRQYYGQAGFGYLPDFLMRTSETDIFELAYLYQARRRINQAPETHSDELSEINYFLGAYEIPAKALRYLESYIGTERFDAIMQAYYQKWAFRHPQPEDFRRAVEEGVGKKLPWLFDGLLFSSQKQDYAITGIREAGDSIFVRLKNKGDIAGPLPVSAMAGPDPAAELWVEGFEGEREVAFPAGIYTEFVLDRQRLTFDLYRQDNRIRPHRLFKKVEPLRLQFGAGIEDSRRTTLYWAPLLSWNNYDKLMPGLLLYNTTIPEKRLEWALAPFFGLGSGSPAGIGDAHYNFYPEANFIQRLTLGANFRSFHYASNQPFDTRLRYARLQPYLRINLAKPAASNLYHTIQLRAIFLSQERLGFTGSGEFAGTQWRQSAIQEFSFQSERRSAINPYNWRAALEHQAYDNPFGQAQRYLKASLEWEGNYTYQRKRNISLRLFGGAFLQHSERKAGYIAPGAFNLISQGFNDYRFDDFYLGRTDTDGPWLQQVSIRDGGFKNVIGSGFSLGRSNSFIIAANLKADLPRNLVSWLPLKPYFDIGYFDNAMPTGAEDTFSDQLLWSGGLMLGVFNDAIAVYFPLINSQNIQDRHAERGSYWKRVAFSIDMDRFNPWKLVDRLEF
ncbi:MAG: M1 family metallopeptidase [Lewinellaceae bacterium]|nr:M1 family metallopeptidase [Lewinellaceae bacterium]